MKKFKHVQFKLGDWCPDLPKNYFKGCEEAINVIPSKNGYKSFPGYTKVSDELNLNSNISLFTEGEHIFIADAYQIIHRYGTKQKVIFSDKQNMFYSKQNWDFAIWNSFLFATNGYGAIVKFHLEKDLYTSPLITSDNRPIGKYMAVVGDFLVLGNLNDATNQKSPSMICWSAFNNPSDFDYNLHSQSDYQILPEGSGQIQAVLGGKEGLIFKEKGIFRMVYVGGDAIWKIETVSLDYGLISPKAIIKVQGSIFFLDSKGFCQIKGNKIINIGRDKVNNFFKKTIASKTFNTVSASILESEKCILWSFKDNDSKSYYNRTLIYNYEQERWSYLVLKHHYIIWSRKKGLLAINDKKQLICFNKNLPFEECHIKISPFNLDKEKAVFISNITPILGDNKNYSITLEAASDQYMKKNKQYVSKKDIKGKFHCRLYGKYLSVEIRTKISFDFLDSCSITFKEVGRSL